jgi:ferric iron reductase protein FhuF
VSTGSYLLECRVPDVRLDNLAFRFAADGRVEMISFLDDRITVREDDSTAGRPGVRSLATNEALRTELRDCLAWGHVAPLIQVLRPHVPVGDRFMWATTADTVVGFILLLGQRLNLPAGYRMEADALASMEPLKGKTGSTEVSINGHGVPVLVRGCCCFAYHLEQYEHCKTCPLLPPETRLENVRRGLLAGSG